MLPTTGIFGVSVKVLLLKPMFLLSHRKFYTVPRDVSGPPNPGLVRRLSRVGKRLCEFMIPCGVLVRRC